MSDKDDFLRTALEEACPEGRIITNWILVLETTDGLGQELHMASSEGVTPWLALGMLEAGKQIAAFSQNDDDD